MGGYRTGRERLGNQREGLVAQIVPLTCGCWDWDDERLGWEHPIRQERVESSQGWVRGFVAALQKRAPLVLRCLS